MSTTAAAGQQKGSIQALELLRYNLLLVENYAAMRNNLRQYMKSVATAVSSGHSYNPLKNGFILLGTALALPVPLALFLLHPAHTDTTGLAVPSSLGSLLATHPEYWLLLLQPLVAAWLFGIAGTVYKAQLKSLTERVDMLRSKAINDPLTGISNRRYFLEVFAEELARSRRNRTPLSLIFLDLDHFKSINDSFGHQAGDEILRVAAEHLARNCRPYDNLARWGGEEFIILLPETDEEMALIFAERIRKSFLAGLATSIPIRLTTSIGVAQYKPGDSVEQLVDKADKALYHAKAIGRNSAIAWSSLQTPATSTSADSKAAVA